ncbi:helix-turn-helix domain-containing protein [Streptomyces millisiae]|uniref:Pyridoxamine 5'-phosphate oxidase family protein n=1 Tax=Streptomyces millisiae TaxID=3075542 RepID=A0ABU2LQM0_9ACTN|nr:pyridoxamine 5'-phosphate oxidase family protein [Streptomyces sp. DSM 44918]MDT0319890.1 pyridoxamine 5'-phosphate oxidase family protein [Streptomyces sp. DSM 44918]
MEAGTSHDHRTDVGRRVALRRERLGLSREEVAGRAGVAPQYLRYLEEHPVSPSIGSLTRVARALDTTVAELSGAEPATPPAGAGGGAVVPLDPDECQELLAAHSVGRIIVGTAQGPAIVPVGYAVVEGAVVFHAAGLGGGVERLAFEVDSIDEAGSVGWSVQAVGPVEEITDEAERRRLAGAVPEAGRPPEDHGRWLRLTPARLTGHRFSPGGG